MGGIVAVMAQGECPVAHNFPNLVEYLHTDEMVSLPRRHPALESVGHLDVLTELAGTGGPAAAFHVGFVKAMGWRTERDRAGSIAWFRRRARRRRRTVDLLS